MVVGNPYIMAYTHAYEAYKETLQKQKDADKEAGELFVTAACIATGSVLLASVGSASMKMIAGRTIVRIAHQSLFRNFSKLFRMIRKNEGVAFAVGKFVDGAEGAIKDKAQKLAGDYLQSIAGVITPEPLVQYLQLDSIMRANVNCAIRMAQMVEESAIDEQRKQAAYADLLAAPLANSPKRRPSQYNATLTELIELSFYLSAVLETDALISWPASYAGGGTAGMMAGTRGARSAGITQRPGAADYPNPALPRTGAMGVTPAYQSIGVSRAGGKVQKRTNALCQKVFSKPLYGSTLFGLGGPADTDKLAELRQADIFLDKLATSLKPMDPLDAIH